MRIIKIDERTINVLVKNSRYSEKEECFTYQIEDGKIYQNCHLTDFNSSKEIIEFWKEIEQKIEIDRKKLSEKKPEKKESYKMTEADFNAMEKGFDCADDII